MNWWYDRRDWRRQKLQPWLSSESIILPKFSIKTLLPIDQIKDNKIWGCQQKSWDKFFLIKSGLNFLALMIFIYSTIFENIYWALTVVTAAAVIVTIIIIIIIIGIVNLEFTLCWARCYGFCTDYLTESLQQP